MQRVRQWFSKSLILSVAGVLTLVGVIQTGWVQRAFAAPALPAGFELQEMPGGQPDQPLTGFAFLPDGSYFTTGKGGRLAWVSATGTVRTIANLPVQQSEDLGLITVTIAPDYATSKQIYTTRTVAASGQEFGMMRLSAWTVSGTPEPTGITNERTVFELPAVYDVHMLTDVATSPDGTLWVSIGDSSYYQIMDTRALKAQDINQGYGKILHIQANGQGVTSNPYYTAASPSSWKSRVYASGFRSPFRLSLDPASGAPVVGDVGWNTWEEVNIVRPGANYGWPCWEGNVQTPEYRELPQCAGVTATAPLTAYEHGPMGTSITGGLVYTGSSYPVAYRGAYFFGDYSSQRLYTLTYNAQGQLTRGPEANGFGSDIGGPVKFATAANGDIVYADIYNGTLKRLVYTLGNRAPVAQATTTTTNPTTRTVAFDGSNSTDLDGDPLTYAWEFGDGTTGTGVTTSHTYPAPGTTPRTVKLTVTDTQGAKGSTTFTVVPSNKPPVLTLNAPASTTTFKVGDAVNLTATAKDPEDGNVTVRWNIVMVHCSGGYCHDHPGESFTGGTFSRTFVDHGDDTRMEITASAADHYGVTTIKKYIAKPKLRTLTITSNTPAATTINGVARQTAQITVGAKVSITAPEVATDGVATFDKWSDGAARVRQITMADANKTLTVSYLTPIARRYASDAAFRTLLGTATAPEAGDSSLRYRDYTGGRAYWTPATGVHEVHGEILGLYLADGAHARYGAPTIDEAAAADGLGRYNDFAGTPDTQVASIYWSPTTGAKAVYGDIRLEWRATGGETGPHGYPTASEVTTPNGRGRFNSFQNGGIYWRYWEVGAQSIRGAIYQKWVDYGKEDGFMGFPLNSETATADGIGRYNNFENGSIYWTQATGAHEVHGEIGGRWISLGSETSYLGYPTSDEYDIEGGRRNDFQNGYITWMWEGGTTDHPN